MNQQYDNPATHEHASQLAKDLYNIIGTVAILHASPHMKPTEQFRDTITEQLEEIFYELLTRDLNRPEPKMHWETSETGKWENDSL